MEQWKTIPGMVGYKSSTLGRIRNIKSKRILNGCKTIRGYVRVCIQNKLYAIHRLVAQTWLVNDDPANKTTVDHINQKKDDNRVSNLRWATKRTQALNQTRTVQPGPKRRVYKICLTTRKIIKEYESTRAAARDSGPKAYQGNICMVCQGKRKHTVGFKWEYVPDRECPGEIWKPIKDHPSYKISSFGRVKNKHGKINDYIHKSRKVPYPMVMIHNQKYTRHVLLGDAFLHKTNPKHVYNHKDGDKWNCVLSNLEVCSQSENIIHAVETGLKKATKVTMTCVVTGKKHKYRSMRHASQEMGKCDDWLCRHIIRKKKTEHQHKTMRFTIHPT